MATSPAQLRQSLDYIITQLHQLQSATQDLNSELVESGAAEDIIERKMSEFQIDSMLELQTLISTTISNFDTQHSIWLRTKIQSLKFPLSLTDAQVQRQLIALFEQIEIQLEIENEARGSAEKREELVRSVPENLPELVRQMEQHQAERMEIRSHWKELFSRQMEQQRRRIIYTIEHVTPEMAKRYKDTGAYQELVEQITELVQQPENRRRPPQQLTAELAKKIAQTQTELTDAQARATRQTDNTIALLANPNVQKVLAETLMKTPVALRQDPAAFEKLVVENILGLEALPEEGTWRQYRGRPEPREIARQFVTYVVSTGVPTNVPAKSVLSQTIRELDQERRQATTLPTRRLEISNVLAVLSTPAVAQTLEHSLRLGADTNQPVNETVKSTVAKISQAPGGQRIPVLETRTIEEVANKIQQVAANMSSDQSAPKVVETFANATSVQLKQDLKNQQNKTDLSQARLAKAQQLLFGDQTRPKDRDFGQLVQTTVAIAQQTPGLQTSHATISSARDARLIDTHVRPVLGMMGPSERAAAKADAANTEIIVSDRTRRETAFKAINAAQQEVQAINTTDPEFARGKVAEIAMRAENKLRKVGITPKTMPAAVKNALAGLYAQVDIKDKEAQGKNPDQVKAVKEKANREMAEAIKHLERVEASLQLSHEGLISTIDQTSGIPTAQKDALIFSLVEYRADTRALIKQLREGKINHDQFNLRQRQLQGRYLRTIGRIHPYIPAELRDRILNTALTLPMVFQGARILTPNEAAKFKAETGQTVPTHRFTATRDTWLGYRPMSTRPQVFNPGNVSAIGYLPQPGTPGGGILNQALSIGRILAGGQGGVGAGAGGGIARAGLTAARGLIFGLSPATLAAAVGLIILALLLVVLVAGTNNAPKYALFPTQTNEYDVPGGPGGGPGSNVSVYTGPLGPVLNLGCPTNKGPICQTPYTAEGHSHNTVNGYDIGLANGSAVYAGFDGFVTKYNISYGMGVKDCRKGMPVYGNYVILVRREGNSPTGAPREYLWYGHLLDVTPPVIESFTSGTLIKEGTPIGRVDNNGCSSGPHLHYEHRNAENLPDHAQFVDYAKCGYYNDCN